jgi:hypothetical protein
MMQYLYEKEDEFQLPSLVNLFITNNQINYVICSQNGQVTIKQNFLSTKRIKDFAHFKIKCSHVISSILFMGNDLNQIVIYDLVNDEVLKIIQEFKSEVYNMSSNKQILACSCLDNGIHLVNLNDYSLKSFISIQSNIYNICLDPINNYLFSADKNILIIWKTEYMNSVKVINNNINIELGKTIQNIVWHKDSFVIAISSLTGIDFYERQSWLKRFSIRTENFCNFLVFSPDGRYILTANDFAISIYNLVTLRKDFSIQSQTFMVNSIIWIENRILFTNRLNGCLNMIKLNLVPQISSKLADQIDYNELSILVYQ